LLDGHGSSFDGRDRHALRHHARHAARHATAPVSDATERVSRFSAVVGRSRFIVVLAVAAVMLVAVSLFLLGTWRAGVSVWHAWESVIRGTADNAELTVEFLEIVSLMLKAVVFYIIGVGLWSLFVAPLNITVSLGVQTLSDLESKVVSVVIVILGVTFLEHFVRWQQPLETLQFGAAMALVVSALVFFQRYAHQTKEDQKKHDPDEQARAQRALFEDEREEHHVELAATRGTAARGAAVRDGASREGAR
jgi:uncharacterized membrane protein YqhA